MEQAGQGTNSNSTAVIKLGSAAHSVPILIINREVEVVVAAAEEGVVRFWFLDGQQLSLRMRALLLLGFNSRL
jgi:hypothetical protein